MKRFLIFTGIAVLVIIILGGIVMFFMRKQTKSFSPEDKITFSQDSLTINVLYNRPYKKERQIFGESDQGTPPLVPYGKVWRTGANEATIFETNKDISFDGKVLKTGKYSLWSIPEEDTWTIIFNSEYGQWGINYDGEANRDPAKDVLQVKANAVKQDREFEQFTISFEKTGEDAEMVLIWDKTLVALPFSY
jgi:hypothetical protein